MFDPSGTALWYHVPDQGHLTNWGNDFDFAQMAVAADGTSWTVTSKQVRINGDTLCDGVQEHFGMYALDPAGGVLWARPLNTTAFFGLGDVKCDDQHNLLLVGSAMTGPMDIGDTLLTITPAGTDLVLLRFDPSGTLNGLQVGPRLSSLWLMPLSADGLAVDADGLPAVCGRLYQTNPVFGPDTLHAPFADMSYFARMGMSPLPTAVEGPLRADVHLFPDPADDRIFIRGAALSNEPFVIMNASGSILRSGYARTGSVEVDVRLAQRDVPFSFRRRTALSHCAVHRSPLTRVSMINSLRALVWSGAMALVSAPVLPQWEYAWAFQSGSADPENNAMECEFMPDGSILLAGAFVAGLHLGGVYWYPQLGGAASGYMALLDPSGDVQWAHFIEQPYYPSPPLSYSRKPSRRIRQGTCSLGDSSTIRSIGMEPCC
ncbi:MAG: hypothetical protein IPK99_09075 [Flavobacteriales bacterium]|nr:hypothetical protein [Flavobacteriales bacterium]